MRAGSQWWITLVCIASLACGGGDDDVVQRASGSALLGGSAPPAGSSGPAVGPCAWSPVEPAEYDAIAAAIRSLWGAYDDEFVLRGRTAAPADPSTWPGLIPAPSGRTPSYDPLSLQPGFVQEMVAAYRARNLDRACLERRFDLDEPYTLLTDPESEDIFGEIVVPWPLRTLPGHGSAGTRLDVDTASDWDLFYKRFPGASGLLATTRVGFDAVRQHALVTLTHSSDPLSATSVWVLLARHGTRDWVVAQVNVIWRA